MQEPTSTVKVIAEAYYQKALELEKQYIVELPKLAAAREKYAKECREEEESDAYGYFGAGRKRPDKESFDLINNNMNTIYSGFINALQNAAAHGSVEAGLLLIKYGHTIKNESPMAFGLQDQSRLANVLYDESKKLKNKYLEDKSNFETEWQKYQADCSKSSEEDAYRYFGEGRTRPDKAPSNHAEKLMDNSKAKYIAKLREAAKYGSQEAIKELIDRNLPLKAPEPPCVVM